MLKQFASHLSRRKPGGKTHIGACTRFYKSVDSNIHRTVGAFLRPVFLAFAAAITLPLLSSSQELPKTTIFLADYQLGVAGAYQYQGNTVYFEARIPEGSTQLSARLLDSSGRTIAISGHSMDNVWLASSFDTAAAARSLGLASALPVALSNELDGQLFAPEISALSNLALGTQRVTPGTGLAVVDSAAQNLPVRSIVALEAANSADQAAARQLTVLVNTPENLAVRLTGVTVQAFVENFPDGENEEHPAVLGRTEVSAQIVSSTGESLIQQIGGDSIPVGWDSPTTGMFRPPSLAAIDPINAFAEAGRAIRVAALMTRFPSVASTEESGAIANLTAILREESLFPAPASLMDIVPEASCGNCFRSSVQVWHKSLAEVVQHSGSVVLHYNDNNPSRFPVLEYSTTYCNHGTCPGHKPMVHPCTYNGPWRGSYRYAPHWRITAPPPTPVSGYHSCHKTQYKLYSGTFWPAIHAHNCNDDTWTQVRAIRGESYDINASDNPFSNGYRCDNHNFADPRSPGCSQ